MKIAAIVLAAGSSSRFGAANKLLAEVGGKPLIRRAVDCALQSSSAEVHVIVRPADTGLEGAIAGLPVNIGRNPRHAGGMGASISFAVAALAPDIDGALILPADMPWMEPSLLDTLIERFEAAGGGVIAYPATADGEQRNPVLWPECEFANLSRLEPSCGARALIHASKTPKIHINVCNERVFRDVDTPGDLSA